MSTSHARPLVRMSPWSAGCYRSFSGWLYNRIRLARSLRVCRSLEAAEVLEIGCHDMLFYQLLGRRFRRYVGLDRRPYLPRLKGDQDHLAGHVSVRQGVAEALPLENASFDAVFSFETIPHFRDEDRAIAEMVRVLKPGGRLVISVPIEFGLLLPVKDLVNWLYTGEARPRGRRYDYRHTLARLQASGFEVERIERLPFRWLPAWLNLGALIVLKTSSQHLDTSKPARDLHFHSGHRRSA